MTQSIHIIIRKIFDDYDEKNGAQQKIDYTDRATRIVDAWTQGMSSGEGLSTGLICELHRLVCKDVYIPVNDLNGAICGFAKAGDYRTTHSHMPSRLHKGKRTLFYPPEHIAARMDYLTNTMNSVFADHPPKELMIENILAFTVEFLTIHPFANRNGRIMQVLMELFAFQAKLDPFGISYINKTNPNLFIRSVEETILYQTVQPLLKLFSKWRIRQSQSNLTQKENTNEA